MYLYICSKHIFLFTVHVPLSDICLLLLPICCACGTSERKARHLYYSDLRERVLRSECRQQEEVYFQLAGYALQADLGDQPLPRVDVETAPYFEPKDYFPPWVGVTVSPQRLKHLLSLCHCIIHVCLIFCL